MRTWETTNKKYQKFMFDLTKPFRILKKNLNQKLFYSIAKFSDILKYRMITSHAAFV